MNVCCVCEADGVMEACGQWYCIDHLESGFLTVARFLAAARGWSESDTEEVLTDWLES